jgi:amidohydrolase
VSSPADDVLVADPGAGRGPVWLDQALSDALPDFVRFRRRLHAHPELSRTEVGTSALILATLTEAGIPAGLLAGGTGVVAEIGTGDPVVALRADIDALPLTEDTGLEFSSSVPGVMHACGHDVHTTVVLATALLLHRWGGLTGRVRLIFQPAEEVMPGGARDVIAAGALDGVQRVFAMHCDPRVPVGQVGMRVGPITSTADLIELRLRGPGGHTSRPHLTADLVHALGTVITGLPMLLSRRLDPRSAAILVWGAVRAGEAANAIPEEGVLRGTLRMMQREAWEASEPLIKELVAELLAPTEVDYELIHVRGVPPVNNEPVSTSLLRSGVVAAMGPGAAVVAEQSTGAEDFADMLEHTAGSLARLGVWDGVASQCDLHSPRFTVDERAIPVGIRVLVHTVLAAHAAGDGVLDGTTHGAAVLGF